MTGIAERVKELEQALIDLGGISASWANKAKRYETELAELRKAQGEPVAWMDSDGNISDDKCEGSFPIPLYTSAPTIPEGWQLVPVEPTEAMQQAGREAYREDCDENGIYADMIAAAPKTTKDAA